MSNPKSFLPKNTLSYKDNAFKDSKIMFGSTAINNRITGVKFDKGASKDGDENSSGLPNFEPHKANKLTD